MYHLNFLMILLIPVVTKKQKIQLPPTVNWNDVSLANMKAHKKHNSIDYHSSKIQINWFKARIFLAIIIGSIVGSIVGVNYPL